MAYKASAKFGKNSTQKMDHTSHKAPAPCSSHQPQIISLIWVKKNMIIHQPEKFGEFGWWINVD